MQTFYFKSPMKEEFKKYIKKEEYNPDINKTEIWIGNFSNDPIEPIDVICEIIRYFNYKNYNIIVDDYLSYNNRGIWDSPIIFNNITFNEEVAFMFYSFKDNISFINCTFKEDIIFGNCTFAKDISFRNCTFRANTNFWHTTFFSTSVFSESKFEGFDNNFCQSHFYGDIFCENIIVKSNINFSDSIFEENAYFKGAILGGEANFSEVKFKTNQKEINVLEYINKKQKEEIDFSIVEFETITFKDAVFSKNVRFHKSIFKNSANFTNTKFCNLVDFYCAHFYKPQQFHFTDFLDRAIFSSIEFDEEVQFLHCRVDSNSYIRFESATFKKSLDISRSNFNDKANFWNIELEEGNAFTSSKYQDDFEVHKNEINSEKTVPSVYKQLRETYRIIKSSFYSQNNKIEGLKFYEKEMSAYLRELNNTMTSKKKKEIILPNSETKEYNPLIIFGVYVSGFFMFLYSSLYSFNFNDKDYYIAFFCFFFFFIIFTFSNWKSKFPIDELYKIRNFWYLFSLTLYIGLFLLTLYYVPMYIPAVFAIEYSVFAIIALLFYLFLDNNRILLYFNKYSNNFGTNWVSGIIFTILSSLLTFSSLITRRQVKLQLDLEGVGNFLKGLVDILNLTDWNEMTILGEKLTNWQYIFLFIGRIFIGYGYYQTIQAFRKFGKS